MLTRALGLNIQIVEFEVHGRRGVLREGFLYFCIPICDLFKVVV